MQRPQRIRNGTQCVCAAETTVSSSAEFISFYHSIEWQADAFISFVCSRYTVYFQNALGSFAVSLSRSLSIECNIINRFGIEVSAAVMWSLLCSCEREYRIKPAAAASSDAAAHRKRKVMRIIANRCFFVRSCLQDMYNMTSEKKEEVKRGNDARRDCNKTR